MHSCPICQASKSWNMPYTREPTIEHLLDQKNSQLTYAWHLCQNCTTAYPTKQPDLAILDHAWSLNRKLNDMTQSNSEDIYRRRIEISKLGAKRNLEIYGSITSPGRFLDIACGYGETVKAFSDAGWEAYGIDTDANTKTHHNSIGIETQISPFEHASVSGQFELIHISHAIYFITNPMYFIEKVYSLLKDDGIFCVSIADFMSSLDPGLPSYIHTFYPTKESTIYALNSAGFKATHLKTIKGTIYIVAKKSRNEHNYKINLLSRYKTYIGWKTKRIRSHLIGRPALYLASHLKKY